MGKKDVDRVITKALRHSPQLLGITLNKAGFCHIDDLIKGLNKHGFYADKTLIEQIGENERFSFNEQHTKIRADYGSSVGLLLADMYESDEVPPSILYHGTSLDALDSIKQNGIIRFAKIEKARDHIFLTELKTVALKKGERHGRGIALPIMTKEMYMSGYKFYHAKNDIWLIEDTIPTEFIDFENIIFD